MNGSERSKVGSDKLKCEEDEERDDDDDEVFTGDCPFVSPSLALSKSLALLPPSFQNLFSVFGFNFEVPLVNLSRDESSRSFATASAHVFQIFRCDGNKMQTFVGHVS